MPTPAQLLAWPASHIGMPYDAGPQRLDPNHNGTDCSGSVVRALRSVGVDPGPNDVSESLQTWAASSGGALISVRDAIATEGAGLFVWGLGANGHVALSRGDGTTYETPAYGAYGHALGVGQAWGRRWTGGALWPDIDYSGQGGVSTGVPPLSANLKQGSSGHEVIEAQLRLAYWAHKSGKPALNPGAIDGVYGPKTTAAVRSFQAWRILQVDGVIGTQTWASLWRS